MRLAEDQCCETLGNDIEDFIVDSIVEIMTNILNINYNDRRIFKALLKYSINDVLTRKKYKNVSEGLLNQYLHHELRIILNTFKREFKLDDSIDINEDHATHAKFNDVIKTIKQKGVKNA